MSDEPLVGLYDKDGKLIREVSVTQVPGGWQADEPLDLQPGMYLLGFMPGESTLRTFPPTPPTGRADA